jgi:hypothetical protein
MDNTRMFKINYCIFFFCLWIPVLSFSENPEKYSLLNTAENVDYMSDLEKDVVYEINLFRSDPSEYARKYIAPLARCYKGRILYFPGEPPIMTKEGVRALNECVKALMNESPVCVVTPNKLLTKATNDHQKDQSRTGRVGHWGSDGSKMRNRIERYATWQTRIAENIAYGSTNARQIVVLLLIDDGVRGRGHRINFLRPDVNYVGVSCGYHPEYKSMCVMDFAGNVSPK